MTDQVAFGAHVRPGPEGSWLCTIIKHVGDKMTVVQVGVEMNQHDAALWGSVAIKLIRDTGNDKAHEPDYMERNDLRTPVIAQSIQ